MELKLVSAHEGWFTIEKAEHSNTGSVVRDGPGMSFLHYSGRISDADVEGDADDMRSVADAIEQRSEYGAKRCAVRVNAERDEVEFWSPRNSRTRGVVTLDEADGLAKQIREQLPASA